MQGQATDIAIQAEEIVKMKRLLNELLSQHTGQPVDAIGESCSLFSLSVSLLISFSLPPSLVHSSPSHNFVEQITERDKFMSPKEAQDFGIVDHVLTHSPKQTDSEASTKK